MHLQDVTEQCFSEANCTPAEGLPKDPFMHHSFPKLIQVIQRESNDSGCKKIKEKKISEVKSYLLWKFVE